MDTPPHSASLTKGLLDDDLIDLEPSIELEVAGSSHDRSDIGDRMTQGSLGSLAHEIHSLRRRRLGAAALFLAAVFLVLFSWTLAAFGTDHLFISFMAFLRFAIAAACAGVIASKISLTSRQVRGIEYLLFGSFTVILIFTQYTVNLELLNRGDIPGFLSHTKNGVMGMFALMVVYGMFIPNELKRTALVVLTMALAMLIGMDLLIEREDLIETAEQLHTAEHAGSNALFLMIGAALAIYGTYVLNGLRSDLHQAKKLGQYQLLRKLGKGGMGEVYLAEHAMLKRPCALKLIKPEAGDDPIAVARFEREVQAAARLSHPNTIEIYDYGHTDDGTFYYVMEYLPGMSLQDLVRQSGPLPAGRIIYLFRQVCAGLAEAHAIGLIHRDLKPANIFITVRGGEPDFAKILDFGLVKATNDTGAVDLTSDQRVSGTPLYMAPEQVTKDRALGPRADIYALGAMMYFSATGEPPFKAGSPFEVMMAHARDPVVPPAQLQPATPGDLEQVIVRCLAKKPDDRYPDVKSLAKALAACGAAGEWNEEKAEAWWAEAALSSTTADAGMSPREP